MIPESLKKYAFFRLPPAAVGLAFCALFMMCILFVPLSRIWMTRQDYFFGFFMPIFAIYVLYDRFGRISSYFGAASPEQVRYGLLEKAVSAFFMAMFACGMLTFLMGVFFFAVSGNFGAPAFIATFGFSFAVFAMAFFASQNGADGSLKPMSERISFTGLFLFSSFAWLVSAPLFDSVERKISLFLLSYVAEIVYFFMDSLGYVVTLRANVLEFPNGSVGVADACSGIRSLTACLFAGTFLAAVFLNKFWKKAALVALSMVFAFINNIIRAMFLSFWAYHNGPESISGSVHDMAGYFVMGMTIVCLLALLPLFQLNPVPKEFRNPDGSYRGYDDEPPDGGEGGRG